MKNIIATLLFSVLTFATSAQANQLAGTEWGISYNKHVFVQFKGDGKVAGFAGCNNFFGTYNLKTDTKIEISGLASTRKYCGEAVMKVEYEFLDKLRKTKKIYRRLFRMKLFDENNRLLYTLRQRDWD